MIASGIRPSVEGQSRTMFVLRDPVTGGSIEGWTPSRGVWNLKRSSIPAEVFYGSKAEAMDRAAVILIEERG